MALPTMRYQTSPAKGAAPKEPEDDQKKAALRRRSIPKRANPEEDIVNDRKQAGY